MMISMRCSRWAPCFSGVHQSLRHHTSKSWINRHVKDHYVQQAMKQDLRARSAFKLQEIQEKYKFIKPASVVIDLGAAPGGWSVIASKFINPSHGGKIISVDLLQMAPIPSVIIIEGDFTSTQIQQKIIEQLPPASRKASVILSDMLHNTVGQGQVDHYKSVELVRQTLTFCDSHLQKGGTVLCKYLQGEDENGMIENARSLFGKVQRVKPKSSRSESKEMYLLAMQKLS
jgi:23S rRNA (uridine2552-2'-O)-methyltransferase